MGTEDRKGVWAFGLLKTVLLKVGAQKIGRSETGNSRRLEDQGYSRGIKGLWSWERLRSRHGNIFKGYN